ncbi:MAG: diadenylate cyclase CdaA [Nitrospirae bacterium]|jgi:diadenylate cyclase|nr:diadenylate cyclase CdaA [Nitrospirota bacterium]
MADGISFSWHSVLDILFVWFIFYQILILIRGTRAFQMVVGILVFLSLYLLSSTLKLYTLNWLITSFWSQLVLALLILFQPEIRKALARVGKSPLLFGLTPVELPLDIDEILKAAQTFSKRGIGAILVLERGTDLSEITEIGVLVDAHISQELLSSIFLPYSPLHDGAVIIRQNRIAAASCFLPISLSTNLSRTLGTRHRAAVGITEETDAVALVVSEETGQTSLVLAGRIHPVADMTELRNHLIRLFRRENRSRMMIRATLLKKHMEESRFSRLFKRSGRKNVPHPPSKEEHS